MGIIKNALTWGTGFNIKAQGPIDSRSIVEFKSDLLDSEVWDSDAPSYVGMLVLVLENSKLYVLTATDFTVEDNWKEIGIDETVLANINAGIADSQEKIETLNENFTWATFE